MAPYYITCYATTMRVIEKTKFVIVIILFIHKIYEPRFSIAPTRVSDHVNDKKFITRLLNIITVDRN